MWNICHQCLVTITFTLTTPKRGRTSIKANECAKEMSKLQNQNFASLSDSEAAVFVISSSKTHRHGVHLDPRYCKIYQVNYWLIMSWPFYDLRVNWNWVRELKPSVMKKKKIWAPKCVEEWFYKAVWNFQHLQLNFYQIMSIWISYVGMKN